jgi:hypothetical protein
MLLQLVLNGLLRLVNNFVRLLFTRFDNNEISIHALFFKFIFFILRQKELFERILFINSKLLLLLWLDQWLGWFVLLAPVLAFLSLDNNCSTLIDTRLLFSVLSYLSFNSLTLSSVILRSQVSYYYLILVCGVTSCDP